MQMDPPIRHTGENESDYLLCVTLPATPFQTSTTQSHYQEWMDPPPGPVCDGGCHLTTLHPHRCSEPELETRLFNQGSLMGSGGDGH